MYLWPRGFGRRALRNAMMRLNMVEKGVIPLIDDNGRWTAVAAGYATQRTADAIKEAILDAPAGGWDSVEEMFDRILLEYNSKRGK